ncbi:MAG: hypothetical protein WAW60_01250 [Candidatus Saccharimonadales bacterium]
MITIGVWFTYSALSFDLVSTDPIPTAVDMNVVYIGFIFSKKIESVGSYSINDEQFGRLSITGNEIRFYPNAVLNNNKDYLLKLQKIKGANGRVINEISYKFKPRYVKFSEQSSAQKAAGIKQSNSNEPDDSFFSLYFPIYTDDFSIDSRNYQTGNTPTVTITLLKETYNYDTHSRYQYPPEEAEKQRTKALDYIKSKGGKPNNYNIVWSNDYLNSKYMPQTFIED